MCLASILPPGTWFDDALGFLRKNLSEAVKRISEF